MIWLSNLIALDKPIAFVLDDLVKRLVCGCWLAPSLIIVLRVFPVPYALLLLDPLFFILTMCVWLPSSAMVIWCLDSKQVFNV